MKNKSTSKKIIIIVLALVVAFGVYNIAWFSWRYIKYNDYITDNMETFLDSKSYVYTDSDGYDYNLKLPDYLSYTGNLCVAESDGKCALLIWPNVFGGNKYGLQIDINDEIQSIMLNENLTAQDKKYDELVDEYSKEISELFQRYEKQWNN